jgi:hypothetical protein
MLCGVMACELMCLDVKCLGGALDMKALSMVDSDLTSSLDILLSFSLLNSRLISFVILLMVFLIGRSLLMDFLLVTISLLRYLVGDLKLCLGVPTQLPSDMISANSSWYYVSTVLMF